MALNRILLITTSLLSLTYGEVFAMPYEDDIYSTSSSSSSTSSSSSSASSSSLVIYKPEKKERDSSLVPTKQKTPVSVNWRDQLLALFPSPLSQMFFEHQQLVIPYHRFARSSFIQERAEIPLLSVSRKGTPLNVFIFGTRHTFPFGALPPYIVKALDAIASTKESYCVEEITEFTSPRQVLKHVFKDLRTLLSPEGKTQYPEKKWTNWLDSQVLKNLVSLVSKIFPVGKDIDDYDPKFVLDQMKAFSASQQTGMERKIQLDNIISERFKRSVPLENEIVRANAKLDEYFSKRTRNTESVKTPTASQECEVESNHQTTSTVVKEFNDSFKNQINALRTVVKKSALEKEIPLYRPTLDDLDFSDPFTMHYLSGRYTYSPDDESLNFRNTYWWKTTIKPLLGERASSNSKEGFPPVLFLYGQEHNQGEYSLLRLMSEAGFDFHLLTRNGWSNWSPKMQIVLDSYNRSPEQKNYGKDLPDDLMPDSQGRGHRELHYGNPKPNSQLPDAHNRQPGDKNHGKDLPDDLIQDEHERFSNHRYYNNPLPDSALPDAHDRQPGHKNYGKDLPDGLIDSHGRFPSARNYGNSLSDTDLANQ